MAVIGPAKQPGEIDSGSGVGNAEFNSGKSDAKFAYELVQVYQLNNPVPLASMKQHGLGDGAPHKWKYVPPAIVGQLLGNLRCALFADGGEDEEDENGEGYGELRVDEEDEEKDAALDLTISQEVQEQIRCDITQSTQLHSSDAAHCDIIPASQESLRRAGALPKRKALQTTPTAAASNEGEFALPKLPVPGTRSSERIRRQSQRQQQVQKTPSTVRRVDSIRPSQASTASNASSPGLSPEKSSVPRPILGSSESSHPEDFSEDLETPIRLPRGQFSMRSSQVMLLDSLLVDDVRQPPEILDSDNNDDDDI